MNFAAKIPWEGIYWQLLQEEYYRYIFFWLQDYTLQQTKPVVCINKCLDH